MLFSLAGVSPPTSKIFTCHKNPQFGCRRFLMCEAVSGQNRDVQEGFRLSSGEMKSWNGLAGQKRVRNGA
jgi:hypothetical protein